jgi:hypothetical protein
VTQPPSLQYEVSISLSRVHSCYAALTEKLYGPELRWRGFRSPGLLRFVKGEAGLLSPTNGGTRAYINIEDYVKYQSFDASNQDFQASVHCFAAWADADSLCSTGGVGRAAQ